MACKAIKDDHTLCRNIRQADSEFCYAHREMTPEVHKERWFQRYILGNRPDHDRIFYFHGVEANSPTQPILEPLRSGEIQLTAKDIARIPAEKKYIDIFLLLIEHGFAHIRQNKRLAIGVFSYYIHLQLFRREFGLVRRRTGDVMPTSRVIERLLHTDIDFMAKFIYNLPKLLGKKFQDYPDCDALFLPILLELSESEAQREMAWYAKSGSLLEVYNKNEIGRKFLPFLKDSFYPRLAEILKEEKKAKYARSNIFKEELMMMALHPDRIQKYLDMGISVEDLDNVI